MKEFNKEGHYKEDVLKNFEIFCRKTRNFNVIGQMQRNLRLPSDYWTQSALDYLCIYVNMLGLVMACKEAETCSQ